MFQQRQIVFSASEQLSKPSTDSFLTIDGVIPYIPEYGYIGTPTDRAKWLQMSLIYRHRPAIYCRLCRPRLYSHNFYIVLPNFNDFSSVREYVKFTYSKVMKIPPEIRFIAQLIPLEFLDFNSSL